MNTQLSITKSCDFWTYISIKRKKDIRWLKFLKKINKKTIFWIFGKGLIKMTPYPDTSSKKQNKTSMTTTKANQKRDGENSNSTPHPLFVRPRYGLHCTLTHTCNPHLSLSFDLLHMSRVFRGQKARHKQRECKAREPLSRCSSAL